MMKIYSAIIYVGLAISASSMAAQNIGSAGDVHFTISIRQGTCELQQQNIDVDLGKVALPSPITVGRELNHKAFSIGLKNCAGISKVHVTMDGLANGTDPTMFALDTGGAEGIALKIQTTQGVIQSPKSTDNTPLDFDITADGEAQLEYIASYVPVKTNPTAGTANAMLDFSVEYE